MISKYIIKTSKRFKNHYHLFPSRQKCGIFSIRYLSSLSSDEEKDKCEINDRLKELLHLEKNWWNPINKFKIPGVREEVRQLEMMQREKKKKSIELKRI